MTGTIRNLLFRPFLQSPDRLEAMSEPLQLVSSAEAVWQMYVTSFPPSIVFLVLNSIRTARSMDTSTSSPFVSIAPHYFVLHVQLIN